MAQAPLPQHLCDEAIRLVREYGDQAAAARALGIADATFRGRYKVAMQRAREAAAGLAPPPGVAVPAGFHLSSVSTTVDANGELKSQSFRAKSGGEGDVVPENGAFAAPDGMFVRSVSTLVDGQTGVVKQQWVKADKLKEDQLRATIEACERAAQNFKPLPLVFEPIVLADNGDKAVLYTVTDYHVGMLAWGRETGADWDIAIARTTLMKAFVEMLASAPNAAVGILNQLGDFLHFDGLQAITPTHGHVLDADSRFQKVVEAACDLLITIVYMMLSKHATVHIMMHEGNHDIASSVWLRVLMARLFKDNPRVTVEQSPLPYVIYQHGNTLLGFHHGHMSKNESLPQLFAARFRKPWGECPKVYIHTGHRHHVEEKEHPGAKVIQHATLAANDAHGARGGWLSEREIKYIVYHTKRGETGRGVFLPE